MNTNVLIPKGLKVKVRTWNDLVFLGKENLIAIRAYWRSREDKLGSHVKWLQTTADFMIGGPSNLESMAIVKKRNKNARRDKDGRFIGGKGSTDFACCGNCRYANIVDMEIFESFDDDSTIEVSHCSLMARIFHRAKYNWFYLDSPCPFFYECKDSNTRIVNSLKREKNKTLKAKKTVRGYIDMLSEAIKKADSKPLFPALRTKGFFVPGEQAITLEIRDGHFSPKTVTIEKTTCTGDVEFLDKVFYGQRLMCRPIKSAQIIPYDEYSYLLNNVKFSKIWANTIEEKWERANVGSVLKV